MGAALFRNKDPGEADSPQASGGSGSGELEELTGQLGKLETLLTQANEKITAYLLRRQSEGASERAGDGPSEELGRKITALAERIDKLAAGSSAAAGAANGQFEGPSANQPLGAVLEKLERLDASLKRLSEKPAAGSGAEDACGASVLDAVAKLQARLDSGLEQLAEMVRPPEDAGEEAPAATTSAEWERAVLGQDLADDPGLAFQRQRLIDGVLAGDPGACALAGQLLVFQSAPAERLPQLLKDIGEAFYRWQPQTPGASPMEQALVRFVQKRCEAAGIYNTIDVVRPGERFDSTRHTASARGVEITEAHGWVVLRDNGKVYTKATVSVR